MNRKTKINLLLPFKMVGELESRARNKSRSQFIEDAIRAKLDGEENFDLDDISTRALLIKIKQRIAERTDASAHMLTEIIMMELNS